MLGLIRIQKIASGSGKISSGSISLTDVSDLEAIFPVFQDLEGGAVPIPGNLCKGDDLVLGAGYDTIRVFCISFIDL